VEPPSPPLRPEQEREALEESSFSSVSTTASRKPRAKGLFRPHPFPSSAGKTTMERLGLGQTAALWPLPPWGRLCCVHLPRGELTHLLRSVEVLLLERPRHVVTP